MEIPEDWFEHRREDRELLGWITPRGEDFIAIDLLGRESEATDWLGAEAHLDNLGLRYLAEAYAYEVEPAVWVRVRLVEASVRGITITEDNFGDIAATMPTYELPFPASERLVPLEEAPGEVFSARNPRTP